MSKNFRESLREQRKDSAFEAEYQAQAPEFQGMRTLLQGRQRKNMTQQQLAERTGITQADISRLEAGSEKYC